MRLVLHSTRDEQAPVREAKHQGPGPHPGTGTPQAIHAVGGGGGGKSRISLSATSLLKDKAIARGDVWEFPLPEGDYPAGDPRNDPSYAAETKRIDKITQAAIERGDESYIKNASEVLTRPDGSVAGVVYTEDRMALHDAMLDRIFAEADERGVPKDRKAVMMGGLPGAGKSTYLSEHGRDVGLEVDDEGDPTNAIIVNPDEIKNMLLGSKDNPTTWGDFLGPDHPRADEPITERVDGLRTGEHAAIVHEESSDIAKRVSSRALANGYNVVFDITVNDADKTRDKYLRNTEEYGPGALDEGYDVTGVFVDVPMETSLHSAGLRHKQPTEGPPYERQYGGRYVPLEHILSGAPGKGDKDRHGEAAKSRNRMAFDQLVSDGLFDEAVRVDRVNGIVYREVEPGGKVLDKPKAEGNLS